MGPVTIPSRRPQRLVIMTRRKPLITRPPENGAMGLSEPDPAFTHMGMNHGSDVEAAESGASEFCPVCFARLSNGAEHCSDRCERIAARMMPAPHDEHHAMTLHWTKALREAERKLEGGRADRSPTRPRRSFSAPRPS
jgi:hypothetical protein